MVAIMMPDRRARAYGNRLHIDFFLNNDFRVRMAMRSPVDFHFTIDVDNAVGASGQSADREGKDPEQAKSGYRLFHDGRVLPI